MDMVTIIMMAVIAISEALALIPQVKSNSVFQLVYNLLRKINPRGSA